MKVQRPDKRQNVPPKNSLQIVCASLCSKHKNEKMDFKERERKKTKQELTRAQVFGGMKGKEQGQK